MKNKLVDLNNHLFAQLERLSDETLTAEQVELEVKRTDAIVDVSQQIIENADLVLKAAKLAAEHGDRASRYLHMLENRPPLEGPAK